MNHFSGKKTIEEEQGYRRLSFPDNRICFRHNNADAAYEDARNMSAYADGKMSLEQLCEEVARTNYLTFSGGVSKEQMLFELWFIGYISEERYRNELEKLTREKHA